MPRRPLPMVGTLLTLAWWACATPSPNEWHIEGAYRWRALSVPGRSEPGFTRLAPERTGVAFTNTIGATLESEHANSLIGSGVALGDADGDGLVDIYLARLDGHNALYRNLGRWRFEDVTDRAGVAAPERLSTGAVFADVDGDGDLDLVLTALGGPNALFVNDGTGVFEERTEQAGLASDRGSTTATLADVDGDADLDLYIANYKFPNAEDVFPPAERTFERVVRREGGRFEIVPEFRAHYRVRVLPEFNVALRTQRGEPDWFYRNDGTGRFEPIPFASGTFLDENGNPLTEEPDYFGLAARFYDVNGDGHPDLYVCNDFEDPDQFWLNDGTGRFRAAPRLALRATSNAAMAVDFADIDRDTDVDFFVLDMLSRDRQGRQIRTPSHTALPKVIGHIDNRPQMQRNTLFLNRGDGTFAQIAEYAGVAASDWSWATLFLDVDLDGYEDILVANGHVWDVQNADADARVRTAAGQIPWRRRIDLYPDLDQPNAAFRNNGDLTFDDVSEEWGFGVEADVSHGLAAADLDGDGDRDVVINRLGSAAAVLRNDATAPRIAVRLKGKPPNTQGVGAKIRVLGGAVPQQEREVTAGGSYLSGSDGMQTFATGEADSLMIVVRWRSGARTVVPHARPNRLYEIREQPEPDASDGGTASASSKRAGESPLSHATPWFADVSGELDHRHVETPFDDFARQPLLPNDLGRLGPGLTWYDVDGDGDEDLVIGSGRGGRLALFRNQEGRLEPLSVSFEAAFDQTTVLALPDRQAEGTVLLVGQMNYEAPAAAGALEVPSVVRVAAGSQGWQASEVTPRRSPAVPGASSSTGPLALADTDGDGDLDLFVGGRVLPARYPLPASSRLYRTEAGSFVLDTANTRVLAEIGMVSAAVFSDLTGDGDPDLVLALEWGPIDVLRNDDGRFSRVTREWDLAPYRSRWNGVTTGDLDGDGRLDIVATSWGRNIQHVATSDRPLRVYHGDFDRNGTWDVVEAQLDPADGGVYPLAPFVLVRQAMPSLAMRFRSFAAYAAASVEELLGPPAGDARHLEVTTLEHMAFLNRGDRFEPVPLPPLAQLAPAFYAGVADFDADGHEDVFLTQNFFPTPRETPRYDAGRGLWLRGDGAGGLVPVPGHVSGIEVYGDQRGAALADYDGDGRVDLAVSQNGAATKLYRNQGRARGLRVRLAGPPGNPYAVGALMRVVYAGARGPAREVRAGSGYWSQDGATQVLGLNGTPRGVWVRWPGGAESETPVPPGVQDITIQQPARAGRTDGPTD